MLVDGVCRLSCPQPPALTAGALLSRFLWPFSIAFSYIFYIYLFFFSFLYASICRTPRLQLPSTPDQKSLAQKNYFFCIYLFRNSQTRNFTSPVNSGPPCRHFPGTFFCRTLRKIKKDIYKFFWPFHYRAESNRNAPSSHYIFCIYLFQNLIRSAPFSGATCILQDGRAPASPFPELLRKLKKIYTNFRPYLFLLTTFLS